MKQEAGSPVNLLRGGKLTRANLFAVTIIKFSI
ncbi:hypothetical protein MiSe_14410 [Microseira wollei NIES-4236]|uniref:Transposase n=1 Tax=Microseira wollei NIES-4236 TaxID=2530354 RepID=A0AAV3X8K1_9CYAN|nr:hypothetical protein MiSe_14410 [Microseira wollei NIES-4236]